MKVFIIEDEQLGVDRLKKLLNEIDPAIEILGSSESIRSTVKWFKTNTPPDLLFMDIELADGQSFEIFNQVNINCPIVFTTSFDEYALQAFKVNSIDYLLKPIKKEELRNSIEKYKEVQYHYIKSQSLNITTLITELKQQTQKFRNRFMVKQGQRLISIDTSEIAYFYVDGRLSFFKTWNNLKFVVEYTLDELETMLDPDDFKRINRSFIVHIKAIDKVHTYFTGKLKLELNPPIDKEVTVSKENVSAFKEFMGK
jgi:DNA-binding LytR/AlgR family response regulator